MQRVLKFFLFFPCWVFLGVSSLAETISTDYILQLYPEIVEELVGETTYLEANVCSVAYEASNLDVSSSIKEDTFTHLEFWRTAANKLDSRDFTPLESEKFQQLTSVDRSNLKESEIVFLVERGVGGFLSNTQRGYIRDVFYSDCTKSMNSAVQAGLTKINARLNDND